MAGGVGEKDGKASVIGKDTRAKWSLLKIAGDVKRLRGFLTHTTFAVCSLVAPLHFHSCQATVAAQYERECGADTTSTPPRPLAAAGGGADPTLMGETQARAALLEG